MEIGLKVPEVLVYIKKILGNAHTYYAISDQLPVKNSDNVRRCGCCDFGSHLAPGGGFTNNG